jgi:hypothetical protein
MKYAILTPRKTILRVLDVANNRTIEITDEQAEQALALIADKKQAILFDGAVTDRQSELAAGNRFRWDEELNDWVRSPIPLLVPKSITAWQAQAALKLTPLGDGTLYDAVVAALAALPDGPEKVVAQTAFEKDAKFVRDSPTIAAIAGALGLSDAQVDDLFRLGAGLSV